MNSPYDLAIIGSGSAAFSAAIRASELDARVAMIERGTVGGTCVNVGCIPSKAVLAASALQHDAGRSAFPGIETTAGRVDMRALTAGKDALVRSLRQERYLDLVEHYGFELIEGTATFRDSETVLVDGRPLRANRFLIATGASPSIPAIPGLEEAGYLTSTTALELNELPERLVVIGGNYIGLESAQLFARLGSKVALLEMLERVAPFEEPEASAIIEGVLTAEQIDVVTSARVERVSRQGGEKIVHFVRAGKEETLAADEILVATGRHPSTELLALDRAGVETNRQGQITADATLRTANPSIFAAGDVTGAPQFVYVAAAMGAAAAENALTAGNRTIDFTALPRVTFTSPQIAAVGLTDQQATQQGLNCSCRTLPLGYVPRAAVEHNGRGLVKLVVERETRRIIGATVVAEGAGDVILAAVYAVEFGLTIDDVVRTWAPYLTMSEGFKLAAQTFDRDVERLSCCA